MHAIKLTKFMACCRSPRFYPPPAGLPRQLTHIRARCVISDLAQNGQLGAEPKRQKRQIW